MLKNVIKLIIVASLGTLCICRRNNVCKTFEDYRTIDYNPNCWYNPDASSSPKEIAEKYGFPFETHQITTQDGYIVNLFRVPHNGSDVKQQRPVVFLQHGFAADGSAWFIKGLQSIVFIFANNGYDVWISNSRGSKYSSRHKRLTVYDPAYWNFSFHEMAIYDIPAMLNFIVQTTNQAGNITFIGHSMGTTISFIYASLRPQQAGNILKSIIAIAPVAYMDHVRSISRSLAQFSDIIWDFSRAIGLYGIGENLQFKIDLYKKMCTTYPFIITCVLFNAISAGINNDEIIPSNWPVVYNSFPSGFSLKTLLHYAQILREKQRFQPFDYGPELNKKLYNSAIPPEYPLSQIKVPVHLFYGRNDLLSKEKDVFYLYSKLTANKTVKEVLNFAHNDFLGGVHAIDFYQLLLQYL